MLAHAWLDALEDRRYANVAALADAIGSDPSFVRRMLNLTLLAPTMIERVLDGMEGDEDALERLAREAGVGWGGRTDASSVPIERSPTTSLDGRLRLVTRSRTTKSGFRWRAAALPNEDDLRSGGCAACAIG